jgi:hypothetical protein
VKLFLNPGFMYCVTGTPPNAAWYGTPPVSLRLISWESTLVHFGHLLAGFDAPGCGDEAPFATGLGIDGLLLMIKLPQISISSATAPIGDETTCYAYFGLPA